ncbi:PRTRC system ThiF family protein [Sphingobacterium sp. BIGb0116]|uniref:PRTRC system ThiF family protein n=1 Tax=Sphingobacterium sp. BIGb0116 TaxID=2940619 RepID=UPI00216A1B2D|nr:PRTRC system ThiF family protein [Sphingobacterium sp. BIGb0116]MCS4165148.1 PRTRC genetic system ThiF family protein [Sphingobacterium sp. BIGb0116]
MSILPKVHFLAKELHQPTNPIKINLIGAGGTGSFFLSGLARLNEALTAHGHAGLDVTLWDGDRVSANNIGRQLFATSEIGLHKSTTLINRINRFFGTSWSAEARYFSNMPDGMQNRQLLASIYISCVDNIQSRFDLSTILNNTKQFNNQINRPRYWLDLGNSRDTGQIICSTIGHIAQPDSRKFSPVAQMPFITDEFESLLRSGEKDDKTPSCSLVDSLKKQSLFINSTLANLGCDLLTTLLFEGCLMERGILLNLKTRHCRPLPFA